MTTPTRDRPDVPGRSYSGKTAQQRDSERRIRLHDAALDLFGSKSFAATTVEELCGRAKVSTRHFYQIYDNKEALFGEVYELAVDRSLERIETALDRTKGQPAVERVAPVYLACVSPMIEDPRVARLVFVSVVGVSPALDRKRNAFRDALVSHFCNAATAGKDLSEAAMTRLRFNGLALAGATATIAYDWVLRPEGQTVAQLEETLASIALTLFSS